MPLWQNFGGEMEIKIVDIEKPDEVNIIVGQAHFIKTVEDVYEALITSYPDIKFGFAFCESSGKRLIRYAGTDDKLTELAIKNAKRVSSGHSFFLLLGNAYPINVMKSLKSVDEVLSIFAATANPLTVIVLEEGQRRGIIGVLDGEIPLGVEEEEDIKERRDFLRKIGYKI